MCTNDDPLDMMSGLAGACAGAGTGAWVGVGIALRRRENDVPQLARLANAPAAGLAICRGTGAARGEPDAGK